MRVMLAILTILLVGWRREAGGWLISPVVGGGGGGGDLERL